MPSCPLFVFNFKDLPAAIFENSESMPSLEEEDVNEETAADTDMKIAWRYKNKPMVKVQISDCT